MDAIVDKRQQSLSNIRQLVHRLEQEFDLAWHKEDSEITLRQLDLLQSVAQNKGASQTQMVDGTGIDRSTLADIARRLVRKGLLTRKRTKADARTYAVNLTEQGQKAMRAASKIEERVRDGVLGKLSSQERVQLLDLLQKALD